MKCYYPLKQYDMPNSHINGGVVNFIIDGNRNIILRPSDLTESGKLVNDTIDIDVLATDSWMHGLTEFLVEHKLGTKRNLGINADSVEILTGDKKIIAISTGQDNDSPVPDSELYGKKLIRPNKFIIKTMDTTKDDNLYMEIVANDVDDGITYAVLSIKNLPVDSITLPNSITEALVNWLAYWFPNRSVQERMESKTRGRDIKFHGHHKLSDIYTTMVVFDNSDYQRFGLVIRYMDTNDVIMLVMDHPGLNYGIDTNFTYSLYIGNDFTNNFRKQVTNLPGGDFYAVYDYIQEKCPSKFRFRAKADMQAFSQEFVSWCRHSP